MLRAENYGAGPIVERPPVATDESLVRMPDHHQIPRLMVADPACGCGRPMDTMDITDALTTHTKDGCNGNRFCAIKYILRAGRKENTPYEKDMRKSFWCIVRELQRLGMNPHAMLTKAMTGVEDLQKDEPEKESPFGVRAGQIWCGPRGGGLVDRTTCEVCVDAPRCENLKTDSENTL